MPTADGPPPFKRSKRNRIVLSCSECKRRKVKCSAVQSTSAGLAAFPCVACVKRNEASSCQPLQNHASSPSPNDSSVDSPNSHLPSFVLSDLETRMAAMEAAINSNPQLAAEFAQALSRAPARQASIADSDAEDVALVLEDMAMGGSRREINPSDSQPPQGGHRLYPSIATETSPSFLHTSIISQIVAVLPPAAIMSNLFDLYFEGVSWSWRCTCKSQFLAELQEFFELQKQHRTSEIDPAWLALVFMQIAMTLLLLPEHKIQHLSFTDDPQTKALLFFEASKVALSVAKYTEVAQVRVIQTIIYLLPFITLNGCGIQGSPLKTFGKTFDIWLSLAVQMAKELRLDQLGDDPNTMPAPDKAFPNVPSGLARQMGSRIWYNLLFVDWWRTQGDFNLSIIDHEATSTVEPLLLNDSELSFDLHPTPHPQTELCDLSFESLKWKASYSFHKFYLSKTLKNGAPDYSTLLELESGLLDALNTVYAMDRINKNNPIFPRERISMLCSSINAQILRIHRPYAAKGYKDPLYEHSSRACVKAALAILSAQSELPPQPFTRYFMLYLQAFSACIGLISALLYNLHLPDDDPDVVRYRAASQEAIHLVGKALQVKLDHLRDCVQLAYRTLEAVIEVEREQRTRYQKGQLPTEPSVAGLFKTIASRLQAEAQNESVPKPPVTPPSSGVAPTQEEPVFDTALLKEMGLLHPSADTYMPDLFMPEPGAGWPPASTTNLWASVI